ncbi:sirohydrochlorin chelatase [Lentzea sp. NEAU-D13]|uniref:Sirohydrochlorin chelatase n=1 Tax=Lentzea alba TaxID=2714351 RepID=A0A7C9VWY2_9PSEU|nr:sirohydrochlorin chelatase [Lentzea alba]NGY66193.1 sirohydrochlorin chelatase [Lentzea alba]
MKLVLAFHGTRDPRGAVVCEEIASLVRPSVDVPVEVAYADVRQPDVRSVVDGPCIVVPVFLASGYHVRKDIPEQIGLRQDVVLTSPLGLDAVPAVRDRLREAGFRRGDAVVLAAAGSSDARALADVQRAARLLGASAVGYVATATPRVPDVVADLAAGARGRRVAVASWLLAPGTFHGSLAECGADVVSEPIGAHPLVVDALLRKYYEARAVLLQSA